MTEPAWQLLGSEGRTTYGHRRGRRRSLGGKALLAVGPLRTGLPLGGVGGRGRGPLGLCDDGLELLQLLVLHPQLVLHLQLLGVDAALLHSAADRQR